MQIEQLPLIKQKLPLDHQGYTISFDIHQFDPLNVRQLYNKFGFAIFNNILKQDQINISIDELWEQIIEFTEGRVKRDDPQSWIFKFGLHNYGFVGEKPLVKPQLCRNRVHPNVYKAFKSLYEIISGQKLQQSLIALFDRGSLLRPSKINPAWITKPIYHFDINPWWWTKTISPDEALWRKQNRYNDKFSEWLGQGNNQVPKVKSFPKLQGVMIFSNTN